MVQRYSDQNRRKRTANASDKIGNGGKTSMHTIDSQLKEKIVKVTEEVKNLLPKASELTNEQARKIIQRYTAAIEGNFLSWMSGATISVSSIISKFAVDENLWVEIKDNHPGILRLFAQQVNAEPNSEDYRYVQKELNAVREIVAELSGIKTIALMAVLENTSATFIPFLAELGKRLGAKDFTYTDVHGEADIEHANQFLEALTDEKSLGYINPDKSIDEAINLTIALLRKIFIVEGQDSNLERSYD